MTHQWNRDVTIEHNARAWDRLARQQAALAQPVKDEALNAPLSQVDPLGWLGPSIAGAKVLCLAAGGGKHSVLYAAAGARVTVVDISNEMLALDRAVAEEHGLAIEAIQGSMDSLSMLGEASFDIVVHPVSTCYLADVGAVFREVARATKAGGLYISQHKSPVSLQADIELTGPHYQLAEPYYREGPVPPTAPSRLRENGAWEFVHRWEELIGGICRAGFVIEDLVEPNHADPTAEPGSFGHRGCFVAPYVRIKARKSGSTSGASGISLI